MTNVQQRITAINQQLEKIGNEMSKRKLRWKKFDQSMKCSKAGQRNFGWLL
jgi:hypothetical protein